jgi:probable HAF family extracellular repeat protein
VRRLVLLFALGGVLAGWTGSIPSARADGDPASVRDLGVLPGDVASEALGLNDRGEVVGRSLSASGLPRPFLWHARKRTALPPLKGDAGGVATGINAAGRIVGWSQPDDPVHWNYRAVVWRPRTVKGRRVYRVVGLGEFPDPAAGPGRAGSRSGHPVTEHPAHGEIRTIGYAINRKGQVAGGAFAAAEDHAGGEQFRAFLWTSGTYRPLGTLEGRFESVAVGLNDSGRVVGQALGFNGTQTAFSWKGGAMTELPPLEGGAHCAAIAANSRGLVVGWSENELLPPAQHAVAWQSGIPADLGTLPGHVNSTALAVNKRGEVVGWSSLGGGRAPRAFLWRDGEMTDLNDMLPADSGWILEVASAINERGMIAGTGNHNGQKRAFLLRLP